MNIKSKKIKNDNNFDIVIEKLEAFIMQDEAEVEHYKQENQFEKATKAHLRLSYWKNIKKSVANKRRTK